MSKKVLLATISGLFLLFFVQNVYAQCPSLNSEEIRLAQMYDRNQNGLIDEDERNVIIGDWQRGGISDGQFLNLMKYWKYKCKIPKVEVTVVFPNGGERLEIGKGYRIQWKCNAPKELLYEMTVRISLLKGGSLYKAIGWADTICLPDRVNTYSWTVKDVEAGKDYQILIELFGPGAPKPEAQGVIAKDVSDGYFEIMPTPIPVTVLSPNGGEKWVIGQKYSIRWSAPGATRITIDILDENGKAASWETNIPAVLSNTGNFSWVIPQNAIPGKYKVKISVCPPYLSDLECANTDLSRYGTDVSDNYFTIVSLMPSITVISPNGGERWEIGKGYWIQWKSVGLSDEDRLFIDLVVPSQTMAGGWFVTPVATIAQNLPPTQTSYFWTIPSSIKPGNNYKIRVMRTGGDVGDLSDNYFEIIPTPPPTTSISITVISPNGGERWEIGKGYQIEWNAVGVKAVDIKLVSKSTTRIIATKVPAQAYYPLTRGSYYWVIPADVEPRNDYKIVISATEAPSIFDESDNYFSIVKPAEDPVKGTLSVDRTQVAVGEKITLIITAQDAQGVYGISAYFNNKWNFQPCYNQTFCKKSWSFTESTPGVKYYFGYVYGRKLDGSLEGSYTTPSFVQVIVTATSTSQTLPDLVVRDIFYDYPYIRVKYCNIGQGTSNSDFLIKLRNEETGAEFGGNPNYRYPVPRPDECVISGGFTPELIGLSYGQRAKVTAIIDWEGRVTESNEENNVFTKVLEPSQAPTSLEWLSSMVASLQETIKKLQETIEKLTK